jgi:hypothetical protein
MGRGKHEFRLLVKKKERPLKNGLVRKDQRVGRVGRSSTTEPRLDGGMGGGMARKRGREGGRAGEGDGVHHTHGQPPPHTHANKYTHTHTHTHTRTHAHGLAWNPLQ